MKESPVIVRVIDFVSYVIALYSLLIVWGGDAMYFVPAGLTCSSICVIQLVRMIEYYFLSNDSAMFNKAGMIVISDDVVPIGKVAIGHRNGIYYMHSGRKEK